MVAQVFEHAPHSMNPAKSTKSFFSASSGEDEEDVPSSCCCCLCARFRLS